MRKGCLCVLERIDCLPQRREVFHRECLCGLRHRNKAKVRPCNSCRYLARYLWSIHMRFKVWFEKQEIGVSPSHPSPKGFGKPMNVGYHNPSFGNKQGFNTKSPEASKGKEKEGDGVPSTSIPWQNYTQKCSHGFKKDGSCRPKDKEA